MLTRYFIGFSVLTLTACTTTWEDMITPDNTKTGAWVNTGSITQTGGDIIGSGIIDYQSPLIENLSGSGNEYNPIFQGLETKVIPIKHTTGVETKVAFINSEAKSMRVLVSFPGTATGNLRLAQIVMPDGQMDGPFGTDTTIELTQLGGYELRFHENMMSGDPWGGDATIAITLLGK